MASAICDRGSELLGHRERTPYGEIDLICANAKTVELIEVKSLGPRGIVDGRVSRRQRYRLLNCLNWALHRWNAPVRLHLAVVPSSGDIIWIPDFLS